MGVVEKASQLLVGPSGDQIEEAGNVETGKLIERLGVRGKADELGAKNSDFVDTCRLQSLDGTGYVVNNSPNNTVNQSIIISLGFA